MSLLLEALSVALLLGSAFFFIAGTVALIRFPDTLCRLHALTKADNVGLGLLVLGLMPRTGDASAAGLLLVIWILVLITSGPLSALLAGAALRSGGGKHRP